MNTPNPNPNAGKPEGDAPYGLPPVSREEMDRELGYNNRDDEHRSGEAADHTLGIDGSSDPTAVPSTEPETAEPLSTELKDLLSIILFSREQDVADRTITVLIRPKRSRETKRVERRIATFSIDVCALRIAETDEPQNKGGRRVELIYPTFDQAQRTGLYALSSFELVSPEILATNPGAANRTSIRLNNIASVTSDYERPNTDYVFIAPEAKLRIDQVKLLHALSGKDPIRGEEFPAEPSIDELLAQSLAPMQAGRDV